MTDGSDEPWWAARAHYWKQTLAGVSLSFALLATLFYILRMYASQKIGRKIRTDDVLMGLAVAFMWGETAAVLLKSFNGVGTPSNEMSPSQAFKLSLGSWLVAKFCVLSMVCCRLAIILFFRTVFGVYDTTRRILNFLAVFNVVWGIVCFCVSTWSCKPVSFYWDKSTEGGWCVHPDIYNHESLAFSVLGLVMDLAILATPLPRIWKLQIRVQHKRAITAILGIGVIVCIFSLLRCIQFAYFDTAHLSTSGNLETTWTFLENDISIICGCMPQLRPLFPQFLDENSSQEPESFHRDNRDGRGFEGIFGWGRKSSNGVETTITSNTPYTTGNRRNSSEMELNPLEIGVQTTVTRKVSERSKENKVQS